MSLLPPRKTGETRYDEALRQLASDDIMRDARYRYDHDNECYVQEPETTEPAGTTLLRELRHARGIDG